MEWYDGLQKPSWTPTPDTIGLIWTVLYPIIFGVTIWASVAYARHKLPLLAVLPLWINLALNFAFTPVQFGLRNLTLAAVVIVGVWATIIWSMIALWPHARWATVAYIPYLIWVSLASILQLSITAKN